MAGNDTYIIDQNKISESYFFWFHIVLSCIFSLTFDMQILLRLVIQFHQVGQFDKTAVVCEKTAVFAVLRLLTASFLCNGIVVCCYPFVPNKIQTKIRQLWPKRPQEGQEQPNLKTGIPRGLKKLWLKNREKNQTFTINDETKCFCSLV